MKIWELRHDSLNWVTFSPQEKWGRDYIKSFDGRKMADTWQPLCVTSDKKEKGLQFTDYPGFRHPTFLVFSKRAVDALVPLIKKDIEVLSLISDEGDFCAINVLNICDCIDYENSGFRLYSSGRIMEFTKLAFLENKAKKAHIFRLPQGFRIHYVSDEFRKVVEERNLTGFGFKLVWDSEA